MPMLAFFSLLFSFVTDLIAWIIKKLAFKMSFIAIQKSFQVALFVIVTTATVFFIDLVLKVYSMLSNFISSYNSFSVSAVAGPNDFGAIFLGVLDASGIGLAFAYVINLYIVVFLLLLTKFVYEKYIFVSKIIYTFVNDTVQAVVS